MYEFENTFYDSVNVPVLSGSSFEIILLKIEESFSVALCLLSP